MVVIGVAVDFASQFVISMLMKALNPTNSEGMCPNGGETRYQPVHDMHHTCIITRTITQWNHVPIGLYALFRAHNCRVRVQLIYQSHWKPSSDDIDDGVDA